MLQAGEALRSSIASGAAFDDPSVLWKGLLLVYADLKRHSYSYCAAFPYLKLPQSCGVLRCQPLNAAYPDAAPAMIEALGQQHDWPVLISVGGAASSNQQVPPFRHVCVMTVLHQATKEHCCTMHCYRCNGIIGSELGRGCSGCADIVIGRPLRCGGQRSAGMARCTAGASLHPRVADPLSAA